MREIMKLRLMQAYLNLMKYARVLLEHCPRETTELFITYFTGTYQPRKEVHTPEAIPTPTMGYASGAVTAVQNLKDLLPLPYMNTSAVAPPPAQGSVAATVSDNRLIETPKALPHPPYTAPQPRTAFSSFVDHPDEFIVFLEACLFEEDLKERDKIDLYTTLFEMYLHKANEKKGANREEWEAKAKKLIEARDIPIDTSNVLLLSHLAEFRDGTILVREQAGLRFDISDPIHQRRILAALSGLLRSMAQMNHSCTLLLLHTSLQIPRF